MEPRRKLLVIAFHYPPDNTSTGVLRTFKFTQYLLNHGWQSHVVSVPVSLYPSLDHASADAIPPEVTVERPWACDVKRVFGGRGLYPSWLGIPDRYWPWIVPATRAGARAVRSADIDIVYSTYPVPSAHLIGLRIKRRFGLPWIADFRDPWVEESMPAVRRAIETRMEHAVVVNADRVICNTPAMRRAFLARYPSLSLDKFVTITNGYDEHELTRVVPRPGSKFHIIHPGAIDLENRNPAGLLNGVRRAIDNGWLDEKDLQITFLGAGRYGESEHFRQSIAEHRLGDVVRVVTERIPYRDALSQTAGADVVVVLSENIAERSGDRVQAWTRMQVPVKLYECLRLGRPLLALVSEGAVKELLSATGATAPVSPHDIDGIAAVLKQYYDARCTVPVALPPANKAVAPYSRENLTMLLAQQFDALIRDLPARTASHAASNPAKC